MRHLGILACAMSGLLWLGGPAGSEEKPAVKKDTFEGADGKKREKDKARSASDEGSIGERKTAIHRLRCKPSGDGASDENRNHIPGYEHGKSGRDTTRVPANRARAAIS